ncbi:hypothetical protein [Hyphomicrobium sp. LHD-15]|uniref:hypothetical protein n=1 Tax=Hyphomicrobium sp. LHD-15 TaxID=3072142 RepID=UPI00280FC4DE|nr:hypothetical protein [Hyphomicrobium sp. LHD-15]MDQ8700559.1 hypothetical protein [Hyphomicrobium sp. LHD-15]
MTLTRRAATAVAVLAVAAIPVGALTLTGTSSKPVSVAVDTGVAVDQAPAENLSRFVAENATLTADDDVLVTVAAIPQTQSLVPQDPMTDPSEAAAPIATGALPDATPTEAEPAKPAAKSRRPIRQAQKKGGPSSGSFEMLFSGPKNK